MGTGTGLAPLKSFRSLFAAEPIRSLQERINRIFDEGFGLPAIGEEGFAVTRWTPSCDIYETEGEFVVKAELPEVKKEDLKITIDGDLLTLRGERKFKEETKRENYHRIERSYGEFVRSFTLPETVDRNNIKAEFKEGLLHMTLPKREEAKAKTVEVSVK